MKQPIEQCEVALPAREAKESFAVRGEAKQSFAVHRAVSGAASGAVSGAVSPRSLAAESLRVRLADFVELAKLRISALVLVVTAVGFCLGAAGPIDIALLFHTLLGTALTAAAANTLNQLVEREYDRLMPRTMDRPIAAGRVSTTEALVFGSVCAVLGLAELVVFANPLTALLAAATIGLYLFAYTPLKRHTSANTLVGAVPGALPPMIGYAGATGELGAWAWLLFAILFVWQLPHFFAIAWMYREDYRLGGYRMLSVVDPTGRRLVRQTIGFSVLLVAVSLLPTWFGYAGLYYAAIALLLGGAWLVFAARMARRLTHGSARALLLVSVIYLPLLLIFLLLDRVNT